MQMADNTSPSFKARFAAFAMWTTLKLLSSTYRVVAFEGRKLWESLLADSDPVILSAWHNRIFFFASLFAERTAKGFKMAMMSSLSKDGEIGAILGRKLGGLVVRGSSSRQGTKGLRALYRAIVKERHSIIILPDGSKGPVYKAKIGAVSLAQLTGASIIPMSYSADRYWEIKSWDRLVIPKPFARISIIVEKPMTVKRESNEEELESCRSKLEFTLNDIGRKSKEMLVGTSREPIVKVR